MSEVVSTCCPVEKEITKFKRLDNGSGWLCLTCHYKCSDERFNELKGMEI